MDYLSVIDFPTFIWDKDAFENDPAGYYDIAMKLPNLFELLADNESVVLMRENLLGEIYQHFPYDELPNFFSDFAEMTFSFLSKIQGRMVSYEGVDNASIESVPNLVRDYFLESTVSEIRYLITRMHSDQSIKTVLFTFGYFWDDDKVLSTVTPNVTYEYETVIADDIQTTIEYFTKSKKIFEHNPKHNKYKAGGSQSALRCYNERDGDTKVAQELLDNSISSGNSFYNFDLQNNVWVVFRNHEDNKYHGYEEENVEVIPNEVRIKFAK